MTLNSHLREPFSASAGQKRDSTATVFSCMVPLPLIPGSELCPVTAIRHYFSLVPASSRSPFYCVPNGCHLSPLTSYTFANTFKKLVSIIGLDPKNFSPHSFRRGGATHAFQADVPEHLIQIHGDWRSDAYKLYLALPLSTRIAHRWRTRWPPNFINILDFRFRKVLAVYCYNRFLSCIFFFHWEFRSRFYLCFSLYKHIYIYFPFLLLFTSYIFSSSFGPSIFGDIRLMTFELNFLLAQMSRLICNVFK